MERELKEQKKIERLTQLENRFEELTAKFDMPRDDKGRLIRLKKIQQQQQQQR
jgi:hypothetical protein